jgi:mRNA interferase MazF
MKGGDIVLTVVPQDAQQKIRPVLILKILPKYNDLLVCAVSSQLHQQVPGFDLLLQETHGAFAESGLRTSSLFRLGGIAVVPPADIIGGVGFLRKDLYDRLLQNLSNFLLKK